MNTVTVTYPTPKLNTSCTQEEADQIVLLYVNDDDLEDYEINELGHVYGLSDGRALVITLDWQIYFE